jgi:hypothetical protein
MTKIEIGKTYKFFIPSHANSTRVLDRNIIFYYSSESGCSIREILNVPRGNDLYFTARVEEIVNKNMFTIILMLDNVRRI